MPDPRTQDLLEEGRSELLRAQELLSQVELLLDTVRDLTSTLAVQEVIERLIDRIQLHMRARIVALHTLDDSGVLRIAMARGVPTEIVRTSAIAVGEGIAGRVASTLETLVVEDVAHGGDVAACEHERHYAGSLLCAPVVFHGSVWGVITVCGAAPGEVFGEDQARLMGAIAGHAAIALLNAERYERLLKMAQHDPLTGLSNHGHFWGTLTAELSRASRYGRQLSVAMIDVDHFKGYNDSRGHLEGDLALVQVARCIEGRCRASDVPARYGGDEFVAILPETPLDGAISFGEKIRAGVAELDLRTGEGQRISVSIGLASYPAEADSAQELMRTADEQLYRAKEKGRNCVCARDYESP